MIDINWCTFLFLPRSAHVNTVQAAVGGQPQSYSATIRTTMQGDGDVYTEPLTASHALTWGEPPGEKPWLETGEVGDWLAEDPTLLRYCWREEAWYKRICLSYSQWRRSFIGRLCVYMCSYCTCGFVRCTSGACLAVDNQVYISISSTGSLTKESLKYFFTVFNFIIT